MRSDVLWRRRHIICCADKDESELPNANIEVCCLTTSVITRQSFHCTSCKGYVRPFTIGLIKQYAQPKYDYLTYAYASDSTSRQGAGPSYRGGHYVSTGGAVSTWPEAFAENQQGPGVRARDVGNITNQRRPWPYVDTFRRQAHP